MRVAQQILLAILVPVVWGIDLLQTILSAGQPRSEHLLLTAVTHHPRPPHDSRLQCLNLTNHAFSTYPTVGKSVFLGSVSNVTYVVLPPASAEGWHRPPHAMFFVLLAGQARVETPSTGDSIVIAPGGRHQMLLALDLLGSGHLTFYPSHVETVALQVPLAPEALHELHWTVEHEGPCS